VTIETTGHTDPGEVSELVHSAAAIRAAVETVIEGKGDVIRVALTVLLAEAAGARTIDASIGHVEVDLDDALKNPAGAMQGAMVGLVGELSAEALAEHHTGRPHVVTDIDVRYLSMGRIGPVHARAEFVGPAAHGTVRVELRDRGNDDRVTAAILARVVPAPH